MKTCDSDNLALPLKELRVLKENRYKKVCLVEDRNGQAVISKLYRGHKIEHSKANSRYAFLVLQYFYEHFSKVALIPRPIHHDNEAQCIYLEYLPQLPSASLLTVRTIGLADDFFRKCYSPLDQHPFRSIAESLAYDDDIGTWSASKKKMSLGLKGDLWQNLCEVNNTLLLADIDSAAIEPLGFSEIVMRMEIIASFNSKNFKAISNSHSIPICFELLNKDDAKSLCNLASSLVSKRMKHLPNVIRRAKLAIIRRNLSKLLRAGYGG